MARVLAAHLDSERQDGVAAASLTGTGGSAGRLRPRCSPASPSLTASSRTRWPVKTVADEHGPSGIRINGLLAVRIATDRVRQLDALVGDPDEVRARLSRSIPLRRYGEPAEFGLAAHSCSPLPLPTSPAR
jgi:3-oxoacyl-[acyl-carrier protein] reductase